MKRGRRVTANGATRPGRAGALGRHRLEVVTPSGTGEDAGAIFP